MPVEAVAHHIETLKVVVAIFSMPEPWLLANGNPNIRFCEMMRRLTQYKSDPLRVVPLTLDRTLESGIDFSDPNQILSAVESAKHILLEEDLSTPRK